MHLFWPKLEDWQQAIHDVQMKAPLSPFHSNSLQFIQALSKQLVKMRRYPELVALGFWFRKARIHDMQVAWERKTKESLVKPRGNVFHVAPSNVDTIFVYSWMLSLLAGNRNIIRVSSKEQTQTSELLSVVIQVLAQPEHRAIAERTVIMTYAHDDQITAFLSQQCHTRVIWGGDTTVQAVRKIPLAPVANELVFPDRFSLAVFQANSVLEASKEEKQQLWEDFFNDAFWFDQMACSSPRLVLWTGENRVVKLAQKVFWDGFEQLLKSKNGELMAATQVQKLTTSLWLAAEQFTSAINWNTNYTRLSFHEFPKEVRERHCGAGLFYEYSVPTLADICPLLVDKDQTLVYFGYSKNELYTFVEELSTRGIDRIVPVGQALNFDEIWDGQNFLTSFTREVVII